ncbi:hypothetical protein AWV80_11515 [Cupriavidus sp. UYMU48A]|nr:hypothetical protein AWV80_11515 [Cupriavidus sp. UYMU48A]
MPAPSAEASSPTLQNWNEFKTKAGYDEVTPEEQVLIWEIYRDEFLPAIAAEQGVTVDEMTRRFEAQVPRPAQVENGPERFLGTGCTPACSGHEAGYYWAADNDISDPDDCTGDSQAFVEGCQEYARSTENPVRIRFSIPSHSSSRGGSPLAACAGQLSF